MMFWTNIKNIKILFFVGFIIVLILFWNRILCIRLPREILLILTNRSFLILLLLCIILTLTLVKIIHNYYKPKQNENTIFKEIMEYLLLSLTEFNSQIKYFLSKIFNVDIIDIYYKIMRFLNKYEEKNSKIYFMFIAPKIILPIRLLFDIFWYNKISFFYYFSILLLIPMIYQYISYNLYLYYLWQIEQMEDVLDFSLGKIYGDTIHYEKLGKMVVIFIYKSIH